MFTQFSAVSSIYLLDEKFYDQMKFSIINAMIFPFEILTSFYVSSLVYNKPFEFNYKTQFLRVLCNVLTINVLLAKYEEINAFSENLFDVCLFMTTLVNKVIEAISFA